MLLLDHFHELTKYPSNAARLKDYILQLAITGKLTESWRKVHPELITGENSAEELFKKIKTEKEKLVREGKIKEEKPLPLIEKDEIPYELPDGWVWCRLGDINSRIHYGYTASAKQNSTGIRFLRITDIQDNKVNWETVPGCAITESESKKYILNKNDILIARTGGTIGKSYIVENINIKSVFASYLIRLIPFTKKLFPHYEKVFLESPLYWKQLNNKTSGTGQPNVNATSLKELLFPFVPLDEQKAIIEKIEILFKQIESLEKETFQRIEQKRNFASASLYQLTNPNNGKSINHNWSIIKNNFREIFDEEDTVKKLRETILQLAVQGKLTAQWRKQHPELISGSNHASELLKKIKAEKEKLIREGKIKKEKSLPPITPDEIPFDLPEGWVWCRLGEVNLIEMGQSPDGSSYNIKGIGTPLINGPVEFGPEPFDKTIKAKFTTKPTKFCNEGDLLVCVRGSTTGRTNIAGFDACIGRGIASIKSLINQDYINYFFLKSRFEIFNKGKGSTFPSISKYDLSKMPFIVPPLNEQEEIINKLSIYINNLRELNTRAIDYKFNAEILFNSVIYNLQ